MLKWVIDDLVPDLAEFLGLSMGEVRRRIDSHTDYVIGDGDNNYSEWFKSSEYYLYGLAKWHMGMRDYFIAHYENQPRVSGLRRLDFGSGIGTRSIFSTLKGWDMTLCDVNEPCIEFSKFRYQKHGLNARFVSTLTDIDYFDHVLLIDTIGHLETPKETLRAIVQSMKKGAVVVITWDLFKVPTRTHLWMSDKLPEFQCYLEELGLVRHEGDRLWRKS